MNKNIKKSVKNMVAICLIIACTSGIVACSKNEGINESEAAFSPNQNTVKDKVSENKEEDSKKNIETNKDATAQKSGSIITLGNTAFEIFNGQEGAAKKYTETISNHKKALGDDVEVYNMVVPTHVEFGLPDKYSDMSKSQKDVIDNIYSGMDKDIKTVDAYSQLKKHKDEYIYFNTDHHWTSLGAYYAYEAFAKEAGFKSVELDEYKKYSIDDFLGTFYTQTQDKNLKSNPDSVEYYKIPANYKVSRYEKGDLNKPLDTTLYADYASGVNSYSVFLHGDFPMVKIENKDTKNKKKIVVVKESYGNSFVPFLIPHYEEVIVIDSRHYKESLENVVKENDIDEVLFINNVFASNTESIINTIENLNK